MSRLVFAYGIMVGVGFAQVVVAEWERLPERPPNQAAEPRRKLAVDPDTLYTRLVSQDDRLRRKTVVELGESWMAERELADVRLFAVNLDADPESERVIVFRSSNLDGVALVAKKEDGIWWQLGKFPWGGPGSPYEDQFIELKQTVRYGTNDLVVRSGGPQGTGVGERDLAVYRVLHGHLYRVLEIIESAYNFAGEESSRVVYPDVTSLTGPPIILVNRTKKVGERRTAQCIPFRWDAAQFAFIQSTPSRSVCTALE